MELCSDGTVAHLLHLFQQSNQHKQITIEIKYLSGLCIEDANQVNIFMSFVAKIFTQTEMCSISCQSTDLIWQTSESTKLCRKLVHCDQKIANFFSLHDDRFIDVL